MRNMIYRIKPQMTPDEHTQALRLVSEPSQCPKRPNFR